MGQLLKEFQRGNRDADFVFYYQEHPRSTLSQSDPYTPRTTWQLDNRTGCPEIWSLNLQGDAL